MDARRVYDFHSKSLHYREIYTYRDWLDTWRQTLGCKMSSFTGVVRLTVIEATGLKPVTVPGGKVLSVMEPYCVIDFDDFYFGATSTKSKTSNPVWGEAIEETVEDSQRLQLTVFHSSTIGSDNFIAHAHIMVEDLMELVRQGHDEHEVSVVD